MQSGCCKPPTSCTYGTVMPMSTTQDEDCYRWNNDATILCYGCNSCKAGVLEQVRRDWHKLSILNVIVLIFLIGIYAIGCCAFRNAQRFESDYPYGRNHMSKVNPRWDYLWYKLYNSIFLFLTSTPLPVILRVLSCISGNITAKLIKTFLPLISKLN